VKVLGQRDTEPNLTVAPLVGAGGLWAQFFKSMGVKKMIKCYGWTEAPSQERQGERVYTFHDTVEKGLVGWTSLCPSPKDASIFELVIGIFPMHQGRGLRRHLLEHTARIGFAELGAEEIIMLVMDSCTQHQEICLRESVERGSYWVYSGECWYPDPYKSFTLTRVAWESYHRKLRRAKPA
jgi:hypothetical protein